MTQTIAESNKRLVLEAFDTLFNKRDYNAAVRFWSPNLHPAQRSCPARPLGRAGWSDRHGIFPGVDTTRLPVPGAHSGDSPLSIAGHRAVQVDPIASSPARAKRHADHTATRCVHAHQPDVCLAERVFNHTVFG
jgi:hypothetical protein